MANEFMGGNGSFGSREQLAGDVSVGNLGAVAVRLAAGAGDERQQRQDVAVARMLQLLVASRLSEGGNMGVVLCDKPIAAGMRLEDLACVEMDAYTHAGYGDRAEGLRHFDEMFRGYGEGEHGPERFMWVEEVSSGKTEVKRLPAAYGDYFEVYDLFAGLGQAYAAAAAAWMKEHPGMRPDCFVGSKFVADPYNRNAAVGMRGFGALLLAAMLRGLAYTNPAGILVAARTQPNSQRLIRVLMPRLVPGLKLLIGGQEEAGVEEDAPVEMLGYIPSSLVKGPNNAA